MAYQESADRNACLKVGQTLLSALLMVLLSECRQKIGLRTHPTLTLIHQESDAAVQQFATEDPHCHR